MNKFNLAQLRHLYTQMLDGYLLQEHLISAAKGLLGPGIAEFEKLYEDNERLNEENRNVRKENERLKIALSNS
jgi:dihydrofolate reductase